MMPSSAQSRSRSASIAAAIAPNISFSRAESIVAMASLSRAEHGAVAGMVEHGSQLAVEMHERHGCACHLERGAVIADPARMYIDADVVQPPLHAPVHDVELHQRRGTERVDEYRDAVAARGRHLVEDAVHHLVGDL